MLNPWTKLPTQGDWVLAEDAALLRAFNHVAKPDARFDLSLYPEPFFGRPDAPVVLLALNPGRGPHDHVTHATPAFAAAARASLVHTLEPLPFLHLQQPVETPGGAWWRRIMKPIIATSSLESVARSVLCVQYLGYHSRVFGSRSLQLPSQQYGFHLVRAALRRNATVVCLRSWRLWRVAVPELAEYPAVYRVRNVRNPVLSLSNVPDGYSGLVAAMVRSG
jgi:hypothetical protein